MDILSYTSLKAFAKSPNHYLHYKTKKFQPTPAMVIGSIADCLILTPEEFDNRYSVAPKVDRRTKAGKEVWEQFTQVANGEHISQDQFDEAQEIANSVLSNKMAMEILEGRKQVELEGSIHGVKFRGYADAVGVGRVVDLKTSQDASPDAFKRQAWNLMYHLQAAIYMKLTNAQEFYWVVVENSAPYNVSVYAASKDLILQGEELLQDLCERFKWWDGSPQGYSENIELLTLPNWVK